MKLARLQLSIRNNQLGLLITNSQLGHFVSIQSNRGKSLLKLTTTLVRSLKNWFQILSRSMKNTISSFVFTQPFAVPEIVQVFQFD